MAYYRLAPYRTRPYVRRITKLYLPAYKLALFTVVVGCGSSSGGMGTLTFNLDRFLLPLKSSQNGPFDSFHCHARHGAFLRGGGPLCAL